MCIKPPVLKQRRCGLDWTKVVFSDEKKFNLDGPDGCAYYWLDLRKEEKLFRKRVEGGGFLML